MATRKPKSRSERTAVRAQVDALPPSALRLTVDKYKKWRATGPEGSPQLRDVYDQVVADLVDNHGIIEKNLRRGLRIWVDRTICDFFERAAQSKEILTAKEALVRQRKIEELGKKLRKQLRVLYVGPEQTNYFPDVARLDRILSSARQYQVESARPTKQENAADLALQILGQHICLFWVFWVLGPRVQASAIAPPAPSRSSAYFKFAKYIYAFVGRDPSDQMIIKRLRVAERWFLEHRRDGAPIEAVSSGVSCWLADGAVVVPRGSSLAKALQAQQALQQPNEPNTKE
jgi:hypothetical protein